MANSTTLFRPNQPIQRGERSASDGINRIPMDDSRSTRRPRPPRRARSKDRDRNAIGPCFDDFGDLNIDHCVSCESREAINYSSGNRLRFRPCWTSGLAIYLSSPKRHRDFREYGTSNDLDRNLVKDYSPVALGAGRFVRSLAVVELHNADFPIVDFQTETSDRDALDVTNYLLRGTIPTGQDVHLLHFAGVVRKDLDSGNTGDLGKFSFQVFPNDGTCSVSLHPASSPTSRVRYLRRPTLPAARQYTTHGVDPRPECQTTGENYA